MTTVGSFCHQSHAVASGDYGIYGNRMAGQMEGNTGKGNEEESVTL